MKGILPIVALTCLMAAVVFVAFSPVQGVPDSGDSEMEEKSSYVGDAYVIELESNPTTGYDWAIISADGLKVEKEYVPSQHDAMVCGAGGKDVFTVKADSPGTYKLVLSYERSWEKDSSVRTESFDIEFK